MSIRTTNASAADSTSHSTRRIERRPPNSSVFMTPACLVCPDCRLKAASARTTSTITESSMTCQRDVIEAEIPNGSIDHAICRKRHYSADDCPGEDIIPVVEFVNGKSAA